LTIADISRYPAHMYSLQLLLLEDENVLGSDGSLLAMTDVLVRLPKPPKLTVEIRKTQSSPRNDPNSPPRPNPIALPSTTMGSPTRSFERIRGDARLDRSWFLLDSRSLQERRLASSYRCAVSAVSVFVGRATGTSRTGQGATKAGVWDDGSGFRV
jgi:hypothetical protein